MINFEERKFAAFTLQNFLDGTGETWDLDDLLHDKFSDELVRSSVRTVDLIPLQYPSGHPNQYCSEEGFEEIRKIIDALRIPV